MHEVLASSNYPGIEANLVIKNTDLILTFCSLASGRQLANNSAGLLCATSYWKFPHFGRGRRGHFHEIKLNFYLTSAKNDRIVETEYEEKEKPKKIV